LLPAGLAGNTFILRPAFADTSYQIRSSGWSPADERGFGEFITAIGRSGCRSVDVCMNRPANPFAAGNPRGCRTEGGIWWATCWPPMTERREPAA